MAKAQITIQPVGRDERAAWEPLWKGYQEFYKVALPAQTTDTTWARFHDPAEPMYVLGAYKDGELLGIVHFLFHRSTWSEGGYCYLQDLFVSKAARGLGLGRALIEAVYERAKEAKVGRVYWLTHETNYPGRLLYDSVADNLGFIQYRKSL
ncbi:MAG: GNAT family N-acetyltransferase [Variibacter sp.]